MKRKFEMLRVRGLRVHGSLYFCISGRKAIMKKPNADLINPADNETMDGYLFFKYAFIYFTVSKYAANIFGLLKNIAY